VTARRTTLREDAITVALSGIYVLGTVLDGRAHNAGEVETFFSPWHLLIYSGFAATALWTARLCGAWPGRRYDPPVGYAPALAGVAVFAAGGLGDLVWHTAFGIEERLEVTLSPPHIALFVGGLLLGMSPLRAAWAADFPPVRATLRQLLPALVALAFLLVGIFFFFSNASALSSPLPWSDSASDEVDRMLLGKVLVTNAILVGAVVALARRWDPPAGAFTLVLVLAGATITISEGLRHVELVVALLAGGVFADAARRRSLLLATGLPVTVWTTYFAVVAASSGLGWSHQLWTGAVVLTALSGVAIGRLVGWDATSARTRGGQPHAVRDVL
jgi:hypothetical protein